MEKFKLKYVQPKTNGGREATPCDKCCFNVNGVCTKDKDVKDVDGKDCVDDDAGNAYFVIVSPKTENKRRKRRKLSEEAIAFILSEEGFKMSARALGRKFDVAHGIIIRVRKTNNQKPKE